MKVIAAYLLALLGGNASPSAKDIKKILGSVGAEADENRIASFLDELDGKDIVEVIASGKEKLAAVPAGGGGGGVVVAGSAGAVTATSAAEAPKEEKEEKEPEEESDDDMGFSLFD
ncbi:hypothetical protein O6H91_23G054900 [Diphasiastrum complanatum]|uniref:Uncharacterized protein n=1 Tax=Diphasiastrum complanatum TaxID=34168 RepID=A0ACC2AB00_DIPCM|nr:hypothetical protein O6H91_23G054900 [Diphasiastrum complanatum]